MKHQQHWRIILQKNKRATNLSPRTVTEEMLQNGPSELSRNTLSPDYHQWNQTSLYIYGITSFPKNKSHSILFAHQCCNHSYIPRRITTVWLIITKPHLLRHYTIFLTTYHARRGSGEWVLQRYRWCDCECYWWGGLGGRREIVRSIKSAEMGGMGGARLSWNS